MICFQFPHCIFYLRASAFCFHLLPSAFHLRQFICQRLANIFYFPPSARYFPTSTFELIFAILYLLPSCFDPLTSFFVLRASFKLQPFTVYHQASTSNLRPSTFPPLTFYNSHSTFHLSTFTYYLLPSSFYHLPSTLKLPACRFNLLPYTIYHIPLPSTFYFIPSTSYLVPSTS